MFNKLLTLALAAISTEAIKIRTDAHNEFNLDDLFGDSGDDLFGDSGDPFGSFGGSDVIYTITGGEGDTCFKDNDCALGYFCDDLSGVCVDDGAYYADGLWAQVEADAGSNVAKF